MLDIFNYTVPV